MFELSYRFHLKFNISLKLPTLENPTFTFALMQIQVVTFQC